jgi:ADP-heptose:LPS heptosyltransferase
MNNHDRWKGCKNILCVRLDNMGDVIMSGPAMRNLKKQFNCRITLLTSHAGAAITSCMKEVDDVIVTNVPWVKNASSEMKWDDLLCAIRSRRFDAAVIFTVYSQSALPTALLLYLAQVPLRVAYARENPYDLLTDWIPDEEPYSIVRHQVERDLKLVEFIGVAIDDDGLHLQPPSGSWELTSNKLLKVGLDPARPFVVAHPGVSEARREYPINEWRTLLRIISRDIMVPIVLTGSSAERELVEKVSAGSGPFILPTAGLFKVEEFVSVVEHASACVTVNTSTSHIAAAMQTPLVVLYALTNPQHTPWKANARVLSFSVPDAMSSRNQVVKYVQGQMGSEVRPIPNARQVLRELESLLEQGKLSHAPSEISLS